MRARSVIGLALVVLAGCLAMPGAPARSRGSSAPTISSVEALAAGRSIATLSPGGLTRISADAMPAFRVRIHNGGSTRSPAGTVTLTIGRPASEGGPVVEHERLVAIGPGQTISITFHGLGAVDSQRRTSLSVELAGAPRRAYAVVFELPSGVLHMGPAAVGRRRSGA